uniref:Uncharacterized protein n=2 Tax=Myotis myotis TaxID=51298 RepID=A0A7J7XHU8_MYOMY|nr:hypothetical protein mMyoMyo1_011809 [Myotis myotis]
MEWRPEWQSLAKEDKLLFPQLLLHHTCFQPPCPHSSLLRGPLHSTRSRRACQPCWGLPFSRGEAGTYSAVGMGEEWRDRGSCWRGGLPGGAPGTGWALRSCHCSGEDESLALHPLPFSNFSVAAVERPGAPLPLCWAGVCTLLSYLAFS